MKGFYKFWDWLSGVTPEEEYYTKNKLHGVSLDKYHYLGDSQVSTLVYAAFFCAKDDEKDRVYALVGSKYQKKEAQNYLFVKRNIAIWESGLEHLANPIRHPSSYLKHIMLERHSLAWDDKIQWWVESKEHLKKKIKSDAMRVAKTATMNGENIVPFKKD